MCTLVNLLLGRARHVHFLKEQQGHESALDKHPARIEAVLRVRTARPNWSTLFRSKSHRKEVTGEEGRGRDGDGRSRRHRLVDRNDTLMSHRI